MDMSKQSGKFEVFNDGSCAFCQWIRARVEPYDTRHRIAFVDYNDPAVAALAPFSIEQLENEMHVRAPDGAWVAGFAAWVVLLRAMPRLAWIGWILGAPPFRWMGPSIYRWIARNRYSLPGAPPRCEPQSCASPSAHVSGTASGPIAGGRGAH
jgi:predicted DCC family thiol-disulfide oxidoreductase YuxK